MNPDRNGCKIFVRRSEMRGTRRHLQRFYEDPGALQRLTQPLLQMRLVADGRNSLTGGNVEFRFGPGSLALRWLARHEPGHTAQSFTDRMVDGPMTSWKHQHIFEPLALGVALTDRITLAHHSGWPGLLTTAALLARQGCAVTMLKAQVYAGGCAGTFLHKGYRFDAGATVAGGFHPGGPRCGLPNLRLVGAPVFPGQSIAGAIAGALRVARNFMSHMPAGRYVDS